MPNRIDIPADALNAVRTLIAGSALRYVVEIAGDKSRAALLHTPSPSPGEQLLWDFLGSLCGKRPEHSMFAVADGVDEESGQAVEDSVAVLFGHEAKAAA